MTGCKVDINGWPIWYEKFGHGPIPLLLLAGGIGTGRSDFWPQLQGKNALDFEKFTIIAADMPGWGKSRPPIRPYGPNVFNHDSEICVQLMRSLGYEQFSILGWSSGARIGLVVAANYPDSVKALIMHGVIPIPTQINTRSILLAKDINSWGSDTINNYLRAYSDEDEVQEVWSLHMGFIAKFGEYFPNGVTNKYDAIKCRALIVHGDRDSFVQLEQSMYAFKRIRGAQMKRYPLGGHNLHQVYTKEFKTLVENFLLAED